MEYGWTDRRTDVQLTDRHMDVHETIIPCQYRVAGYKKYFFLQQNIVLELTGIAL